MKMTDCGDEHSVEEKCQERDEGHGKGVSIESEEKKVIDTEKDKRREKRRLHVGQANPVVQEALVLLVDPVCNKEEEKGRILLIILSVPIFLYSGVDFYFTHLNMGVGQ